MLSPLEIALQRQREKRLLSCHECKNCVKVGGWWYCEDDGKMLHPMMLERFESFKCERAILKEE